MRTELHVCTKVKCMVGRSIGSVEQMLHLHCCGLCCIHMHVQACAAVPTMLEYRYRCKWLHHQVGTENQQEVQLILVLNLVLTLAMTPAETVPLVSAPPVAAPQVPMHWWACRT